MIQRFQPGEPVFWWKRARPGVEVPYRARVLEVGAKRVKIAVEDLGGAMAVRHVAAECLQCIGVYYEKAVGLGPDLLEPVALWGTFTRYWEVGEDLWALRQVDVFRNGNALSYDHCHWMDAFGMLGDARINRNRKEGSWGRAVEIDAAEFEHWWQAARHSTTWGWQVASEQMSRRGPVPAWLRNKR